MNEIYAVTVGADERGRSVIEGVFGTRENAELFREWTGRGWVEALPLNPEPVLEEYVVALEPTWGCQVLLTTPRQIAEARAAVADRECAVGKNCNMEVVFARSAVSKDHALELARAYRRRN